MKREIKPPKFAPTVLLALLSLAIGCDFPLFRRANQTTQATLAVPHQEGAALEVVTENGSIVVASDERDDVQVIASLRSHSLERLEAVQINVERDSDGKLLVAADWPDGRQSHEQFHVRVLVPDADGVALSSRNGSLNLTGLAGRATLVTMNGAIRVVSHDGPIEAKTNNGRVKIAGVGSHALDVETHNGAVQIDGAGGELSAESSNGSIQIGLPPGATGPMTARTSNGSVSLTLSPEFAGSLSLANTVGELVIDERLKDRIKSRTKHTAELVWDIEGPESFASTKNGALSVRLTEE